MNANRACCAAILACLVLVSCGKKVASQGEQCAPGFMQNPPDYPPCDVGLVCVFCIPDTGGFCCPPGLRPCRSASQPCVDAGY